MDLFFDKNSPWVVKDTKKGVVCQEEISQDTGFAHAPWGDRDKELLEKDEGNQGQNLHSCQPTKESLLPTPAGRPSPCPIRPNKIHCPLSSDRNPSGNLDPRRRNQGIKKVGHFQIQ